jgi:hypothetical protein
MALIAAILGGIGNYAVLLEHAISKLLGNWIRRQGERLEMASQRKHKS